MKTNSTTICFNLIEIWKYNLLISLGSDDDDLVDYIFHTQNSLAREKINGKTQTARKMMQCASENGMLKIAK